MDDENYQITRLKQRVRELEEWQEKAREDIARLERCIVALAEPRSTQINFGDLAHLLTHDR
jgi:hypothetical protein